MEISESTWAFIAKHRREDVRDVALHAKHDATWMCRSRWSKLPAGSALHSSYLTGRPMMG